MSSLIFHGLGIHLSPVVHNTAYLKKITQHSKIFLVPAKREPTTNCAAAFSGNDTDSSAASPCLLEGREECVLPAPGTVLCWFNSHLRPFVKIDISEQKYFC